jgi:hypothetical protein
MMKGVHGCTLLDTIANSSILGGYAALVVYDMNRLWLGILNSVETGVM